MKTQPQLSTERLLLRPFHQEDARTVQRLAGDDAIADTAVNIPHPYEDGMAEEWIASHGLDWISELGPTFAVALAECGTLVGAVGLRLTRRFDLGEIGYWIGKPYWGMGYCTEAVRAMLRFGFGELGLNRIYGTYLARNPASGRVMMKAGLRHECTARQAVKHRGRYEDLMVCAVLRSDFNSEAPAGCREAP